MRPALFVMTILLAGSGAGWGQALAAETGGGTVFTPYGARREPPTEGWGTVAPSILVMDAMAFVPHIPSTGWGTHAGWMKTCTNPPCIFFHSVQLASGTQVNGIEIEGCDHDANPNIDLEMLLVHCHDGVCDDIPDASGVSTSGSPGCGYFRRDFQATPTTVDNRNGTYFALIAADPTPNLRFRGARIYYKLQVSPAPATATFPNDVPTTHPFFRFVEALAGAGVTGGCATGSYCPDSPVTRGQMAVFLATALGLHYPN